MIYQVYTLSFGIKPNFATEYFYDRIFNGKIFEVYNPQNLISKNFGGRLFVDSLNFSIKSHESKVVQCID